MSAMHRASTRRGRGVHTPLPEFSTFCRCRGPYLVSSPTRAVQSPHMPICSWDVRERMVISRSLVISRATGTGGGADVLDRPRTTPGEPKTRRRRGRPSIYKVLLHNDDYNKREYVVQVLLKHVEGYTVEDALNVMREAHEYGLALVCECAQDKAEETCESLRLCGLICTIEPR